VDLQWCLELAYQSHPVILSARERVVQAQASLDSVWALYYPSLGISNQVVRQGQNSLGPTIVPSWQELNSFVAQLTINQTILDSGQRREQVAAAEENVKAAVFNLQSTWINQVQQIQQAFCDTLQQELLLGTFKDNLYRTKVSLDISEKLYKAGQKSMVDITQARTLVAQALVQVARGENLVRDLRLQLAQLVGVPAATLDGRPLDNILLDPVVTPPRELAVQELNQNPQLTSLAAGVRSNEALERLQWANQLPSLTGSVGYGAQGTDWPQYRFWQAGVTLNIPFYNPATEPNARQFKAIAAQLEQDKATALLRLLQLLDQAYSDVRGARERADAGAQETSLALKNFDLAQKRYEAGLSDITELINARSFVLSAQSDLVAALHDLKVAEGRMQQARAVYATGTIPEPAPAAVPSP